MVKKSYLTGFISKFNFGKELVENVEIQVNSKGNRVHCLTEDKSMYMDIHSKEFMFDKSFILPDIAKFLRYLNVFEKDFEYELVEEDGEAYKIKLYDVVTNFEYGLGEDILLMNTKAPASMNMEKEDILISIDEKKANAILNALKLTNSYFVGIKADKHNIYIKIGDEEIKEPVIEIVLDGKIMNIEEEQFAKFSLNNFLIVLSANKNCNIKVKFGKEKGSGMIIESEDDNYECIYGLKSLVK